MIKDFFCYLFILLITWNQIMVVIGNVKSTQKYDENLNKHDIVGICLAIAFLSNSKAKLLVVLLYGLILFLLIVSVYLYCSCKKDERKKDIKKDVIKISCMYMIFILLTYLFGW